MGKKRIAVSVAEHREHAMQRPGKKAKASVNGDVTNAPSSNGSAAVNPFKLRSGEDALRWLIGPTKVEEFHKKYFEKNPLHVKRKDPGYYSHVFSSMELMKICMQDRIEYTKNIDITSYREGVRETHNPTGKVYPNVLSEFLEDGCSVRFLNPATYSKNVWRLNYLLTEYFGSFCGANVYWTPEETQGFAPHWDDVDVFILQLEGQKHWKLHHSHEDDRLPLESSGNFSQEEVGNPNREITLSEGDLLYLPRGHVHQARTVPGCGHSFHITISTYQQNTWSNFLEKLMPVLIEKATTSSLSYREGLPLRYLQTTGLQSADAVSEHGGEKLEKRKDFMDQVKEMVAGLADMLDDSVVDDAADSMAINLIHESLPPCLSKTESIGTIHRPADTFPSLDSDSTLTLIGQFALRVCPAADLTDETEGFVDIFHTADNTRQYKEIEVPYRLRVKAELAFIPEVLVNAYPNSVTLSKLVEEADGTVDEEEILGMVADLYRQGLIRIKDKTSGDHEDD
eukprot:Clim_evm77s236 gene=Clim_evmTU77s236